MLAASLATGGTAALLRDGQGITPDPRGVNDLALIFSIERRPGNCPSLQLRFRFRSLKQRLSVLHCLGHDLLLLLFRLRRIIR